jgi:hypothetical protein
LKFVTEKSRLARPPSRSVRESCCSVDTGLGCGGEVSSAVLEALSSAELWRFTGERER